MIQVLSNIKNAVVYNEKLYFVPSNFCSLFELDINSGYKVRCVCDFPWILYNGPVECILDENKVWCITMKGLQISSYNLANGEIEYFCFSKGKERDNITSIMKGNVIWVFPRNIPEQVIGFSITEKKFFCNDELTQICNENQISGRIISNSNEKNNVAMLIEHSNKILLFSLDKLKFELKIVPSVERLFGILYENNMFYLTSEESRKILIWDTKNDTVNVYEDMNYCEGSYIKIHKVKQKLVVTDGIKIQVFDGNEIKDYKVDSLKNPSQRGSHFMSVIKLDERYIFLPWNANLILETDGNMCKSITHELVCPIVDWVRKINYFYEGKLLLKEYIQAATRRDKELTISLENKTIGYEIYNQLQETK